MNVAQAKEEDNISIENARGILCVSGAVGYLASCLIKHLLQRGYHVRGTVWDPGN
jgi:hypothetical protein